MELLKGFSLWIGALALGILLLFAVCPRLLTGSYADITIDSFSIDKNGQCALGFSTLTPPGTMTNVGFYNGTRYGGGGVSGRDGIMGWPTRGTEGVMFTLDPESAIMRRSSVPRPDRLLVKVGETRRLHRGERLYFYDFITADSLRHDGYVEVETYDSTRFPRPMLKRLPLGL